MLCDRSAEVAIGAGIGHCLDSHGPEYRQLNVTTIIGREKTTCLNQLDIVPYCSFPTRKVPTMPFFGNASKIVHMTDAGIVADGHNGQMMPAGRTLSCVKVGRPAIVHHLPAGLP